MTSSYTGGMFGGGLVTPEQHLRQQLAQHEKRFQDLQAVPLEIVTIVTLVGNRAIIAGTPPIEVSAPPGAKPGQQMRSIPQNKNGFSLLPEPVSFGGLVTIKEVQGNHAVIEQGHVQGFCVIAEGLELRAGDRAVVDPTASVVLKKIEGPATPATGFELRSAQKVSWDDIGGQEEAKEALREAIEYPVRFAEVYAAHGQKPARGVLLSGPAGTGKTLLAKALATSVSGDTGGFFYVKGAEALEKFVGQSEANIRGIFARAKAYREQTGKRAIIFFDEADAILSKRETTGNAFAGIGVTLVATFLAEMDGLDDHGAFVLLSTNKPESLDPAVVRDGRIDQKVRVGRPDRASTEAIFKLALRGKRCDAETLAAAAADELFETRHKLYELSWNSVAGRPEVVYLSDCVSGAMVTGIVQKAVESAVKRDRESGELSAVGFDDVKSAIEKTFRQLAQTSHAEVIAEKSESYGRAPDAVRRLVRG
jgi:SpoVK/Ycf46/Vps4 family AAA+-type ATPase